MYTMPPWSHVTLRQSYREELAAKMGISWPSKKGCQLNSFGNRWSPKWGLLCVRCEGNFISPNSRQKPAVVLRNLWSWVLSIKRSISFFTGRKDRWLSVTPTSIPKHVLVCRLPQYHKYLLHISEPLLASWLFSALLVLPPPLNLSTSCVPRTLPSCSFSFIVLLFYYALSLSPTPSLPSYLGLLFSLSCCFLPILFLRLSWPGPVCWACLVYYFFSFLWTLPVASGYSIHHIYNKKSLPLNYTMEQWCHQFISLA